MQHDELMKKIEAFIAGPVAPRPTVPVKQREDHGQGDVKDPKHDRRLKQNQEKEHAEMSRQIQETEENAGEDKDVEHAESHEEQEVRVPYERERVDHRASKQASPDSPTSGVELAVTKQMPMDRNPGFEKFDHSPNKVKMPKQQFDPMSADERSLRNHPVYGPYANQFLGPKVNPHGLLPLRQKIQNLMEMAASEMEREELQKYASLIANLIVKTL